MKHDRLFQNEARSVVDEALSLGGEAEREDGDHPGCCNRAGTFVRWETSDGDLCVSSAAPCWALVRWDSDGAPDHVGVAFCPFCGTRLPE